MYACTYVCHRLQRRPTPVREGGASVSACWERHARPLHRIVLTMRTMPYECVCVRMTMMPPTPVHNRISCACQGSADAAQHIVRIALHFSAVKHGATASLHYALIACRRRKGYENHSLSHCNAFAWNSIALRIMHTRRTEWEPKAGNLKNLGSPREPPRIIYDRNITDKWQTTENWQKNNRRQKNYRKLTDDRQPTEKWQTTETW